MLPVGRERTKFVADAMLGSLARKLRALGFDTSYFRSGSDSDLLALAEAEGRVILSSDRSLVALAQRRGRQAILVVGRSDRGRIRGVATGAKALGLRMAPGDPLCSVCGGSLAPLPKSEAVGQVPPAVRERHRAFYRCERCGKVYWKGGHWKKLRSLAGPLKAT